jgi:hypothetical protein
MPLPGSWTSATYLLKNKCLALNTLFHSDEYTITREAIFVSLAENLTWTQRHGGLNVTITGKVVVTEYM